MEEAHYYCNEKQTKDLPKVLVIGPPGNMATLKPKYPQKYSLSNPWDASLPLHKFMAENHYEPTMFEALLCWPFGPPINAHVFQLLPCVKLVITTSTGTDHIDISECHCRGIQVANVGTLYSEDVADIAVALLIDVLTKLSAADRFVKTRMPSATWHFPLCSNSKLGGKRVGIVGLGSIGMKVAKRLEAFGCIISYLSRNKNPFVSEYPFYSNMVELAATSDALVLCCPLNETTRHMVNKEVMLALGNKGVIVNVGRGSLIDEKELVKCLMEGHIGGAGLDVFENEPNVPQELLAMDNVVLSPHNASFTIENHMATAKLVAENLEAFLSNKPLITPVRLH
ncbi:glyoxylate/hydroxypyruvate reductase HPR3-like [Gastrolobium bilobum]|uniref:glyoxylate/hydroxypyruvate reductase HPR3-like n=1 Tax=Gastrolobium bilobum TaxID=150636 RepID=UPI002AB0BB14|nr:glyoxylate/hydroxypyruvate reductase HPR3-like [Gastrolobium bilobum]